MNAMTNNTLTHKHLEEAAQWSARLADGEAVSQALEAWLATDPEHRRAYEALSSTLQSVDQFAGTPEMVNLREDALSVARRSHDVLRAKAFFTSRLGMAAAVAVLAIALGAAGLWLHMHSKVFETGIGERRVFALADGSSVSLDAATRVKADYTAQRRRLVLERGRAKFDVAKDPLRPFTVEAGGKVVVATGTSFSVELVKTQLHVVLYEGRVEVLQAAEAKDKHASHWILDPGHELIVSDAGTGTSTHVAAIEPARESSWEEGELAFTEEPLGLAVERINRYSKEKVSVADAAVKAVRISGVFHAGDTEAFVDGVTALFPVRAERGKDGVQLMFEEKARR